MLAAIGVPSIDTLFEVIPPDVRLGRPLAIEPSLDEARLMDHLGALAEKNVAARALSCSTVHRPPRYASPSA